MSAPLFSIGGIASGLDTQAILEQLVALERQPIQRIRQRQAQLRQVDEAWGRMTTRLSALRSSVDQLRRPEGLAGQVTATSSHDAVKATAGAGAVPGSVAFTVERVATAHRVAGTRSFAGPDALVGAGQVTITLAGGAVETFETDGTTTLAELAQRVNQRKVGVSAQVVQTAAGSHRLVLSATRTGAEGAFTLSGDLDGLGAGEVLEQGADAHLRLGTLDVYRASNTVTDLVDGVTLQLSRATTEPVTVAVERDLDAAVARVKGLVDSLNAALKQAKDLSAYNPDTGAAGPLQGDSTLRSLTSQLRSAVSGVVAGLPDGANHGSSVGLRLTRDGAIALDETKLRQALADDFDATVSLFARAGGTTDARVSYAASTERTAAGSYGVTVTRAAQAAAVAGSGYTPPAAPSTFTLTTPDGRAVTVDLTPDDTTAEAAAARIGAALAAAGITAVRAEAAGGAVRLAGTRPGSANGFDVAGGAALGIADGSYRGEDVAGTIGGAAAVGRGRTLTAEAGDALGLAVSVAASQAQVDAAGGSLGLGTVTVTHGIGGALDRVLRQFEGGGGRIADARQSLSTRIRRFDASIADFELRVAGRERTLRRQFTALENAMGQLQAQSSWMASQLAGLSPRA